MSAGSPIVNLRIQKTELDRIDAAVQSANTNRRPERIEMTLQEKSNLTRKRSGLTRDEALAFVETFGIGQANRRMLELLTPAERVAARQAAKLERRQSWERETFGRVLTVSYDPTCDLDPKYLTT